MVLTRNELLNLGDDEFYELFPMSEQDNVYDEHGQLIKIDLSDLLKWANNVKNNNKKEISTLELLELLEYAEN